MQHAIKAARVGDSSHLDLDRVPPPSGVGQHCYFVRQATLNQLLFPVFCSALQYAIEGAEAGDYSELDRLMQVLAQPYDEQPEADAKYSSKPPPEMVRPGVCVLSCSS
jgi:hypothetical protein